MVTTESVNSSGGGLERSLYDEESGQADECPNDKSTGFAKPEVKDVQHRGSRSTFKKRSTTLELAFASSPSGLRTHRGPEHRTTTMLRSQPMRPVPITAMKIADGAAYAALRTSSLERDVSDDDSEGAIDH
jgi:hypothetical protein